MRDDDPKNSAQQPDVKWVTTSLAPRPVLDPLDDDDQAMFAGYVCSKAGTLHEIGVERYRAQDAFGMPSAKFGEALLAGV